MKHLLLTVAGGAALLAAGAVIQYTREIRQFEQVEAFLEREAAKQQHPSMGKFLDDLNTHVRPVPFLVNVEDYKPGGRFDV